MTKRSTSFRIIWHVDQYLLAKDFTLTRTTRQTMVGCVHSVNPMRMEANTCIYHDAIKHMDFVNRYRNKCLGDLADFLFHFLPTHVSDVFDCIVGVQRND
jgi:hypothetical protein